VGGLGGDLFTTSLAIRCLSRRLTVQHGLFIHDPQIILWTMKEITKCGSYPQRIIGEEIGWMIPGLSGGWCMDIVVVAVFIVVAPSFGDDSSMV